MQLFLTGTISYIYTSPTRVKISSRIYTQLLTFLAIHRAIHASAVYHLLVARLDRYLKNKKDRSKDNQFAKVEIIKKSNLSTENINSQIISSSNSRQNNHSHHKRFTFRGQKIDSKTRSHPNLSETTSDGLDDQGKNNIINLIARTNNTTTKNYSGTQPQQQQQQRNEGTSLENNNNNNNNAEKKSSISGNHLSVENSSSRGTRGSGNRRSNSTVDVNEYRKSQEIQETIRNSLICESKEDLEKINGRRDEKQERLSPESPKEPFPKSVKGIISRKQSFDVGADLFRSSVSNDGDDDGNKSIDVTQFIEPTTTPRRHSSERMNRNKHRKMSADVLETSTEVRIRNQTCFFVP